MATAIDTKLELAFKTFEDLQDELARTLEHGSEALFRDGIFLWSERRHRVCALFKTALDELHKAIEDGRVSWAASQPWTERLGRLLAREKTLYETLQRERDRMGDLMGRLRQGRAMVHGYRSGVRDGRPTCLNHDA